MTIARCPNCSRRGKLVTVSEYEYFVRCKNTRCPVMPASKWHKTPDLAIVAWNHRDHTWLFDILKMLNKPEVAQ